MAQYAVYARFILEADSEEDATDQVHDIVQDENVDEVWVAAVYEETEIA